MIGHRELLCIPTSLQGTFSTAAEDNSRNLIETGGLLFGRRRNQNSYVLTHLYIPEQRGTSDFWEATNPAEIVDFQVTHGNTYFFIDKFESSHFTSSP